MIDPAYNDGRRAAGREDEIEGCGVIAGQLLEQGRDEQQRDDGGAVITSLIAATSTPRSRRPARAPGKSGGRSHVQWTVDEEDVATALCRAETDSASAMKMLAVLLQLEARTERRDRRGDDEDGRRTDAGDVALDQRVATLSTMSASSTAT